MTWHSHSHKSFRLSEIWVLTQTLFRAAKLITLTPSLSALKIAASIWLLMPCLANGKKYCQKRKKYYKTICSLYFQGQKWTKKKREALRGSQLLERPKSGKDCSWGCRRWKEMSLTKPTWPTLPSTSLATAAARRALSCMALKRTI